MIPSSKHFVTAFTCLTIIGCRETAADSTSGATSDKTISQRGTGKRDREPANSPPVELAQEEPRGSSTAPPTMWLQPADLMTSTGETPIQVMLTNTGTPIDPRILSTIASNIELRTYPDLRLVPATINTHLPKPFVPPQDQPNKDAGTVYDVTESAFEPAYVQVIPKSKLRDSWHVLSLKQVPSGVKPVPWSAPKPPTGAYAVRFHPGSRPTIKRVLFCEKGSGSSKIVYDLSENVEASSSVGVDSLVAAEQVNQKSHCSVGAGPSQTSTRWIHLACDAFDPSTLATISLMAGLSSRSGVPLSTFGGRTTLHESVLASSLPSSGDGCRVWQPE